MRVRIVLALAFAALLFPGTGAAAGRALGPLSCDADGLCSGYVTVPLDRTGAVPGKQQLWVVVQRPDGMSHGAVFELAGGPGQASTDFFPAQGYTPFPGYLQIAYDDRGTGQSDLLACALDPTLDIRAEIGACGDELGPRGALYSTRDNADDMDAIRAALGLDKVAVWGTSYGTRQALAYAQAYPAHVDRLLLDSESLPGGPDPYGVAYASAIPAALSTLCARDRCAAASADPVGELAALANRLAAKPIVRRQRLDSFPGPVVTMHAFDLLGTAISTDLNPAIGPILPGAVRSALAGRPQELLRLDMLLDRPAGSSSVSPVILDVTNCDDVAVPWAPGTPVSQRQAVLDAAVHALPSDAFAPFGSWLSGSGAADYCLAWQGTGLHPLAVGPYPDVPTLVLEGDLDVRTPVANGQAVAGLFPHGHLLVAHGVGHDVLGPGMTQCASRAVATWLAGGTPPASCAPGVASALALEPVVPYIPPSLAATPPVAPGGRIGRTLAAVRITMKEADAFLRLEVAVEFRIPPLAGISAGWFGGSFDKYADVPGVVVDGGGSTFRISGRNAAHGTLHFARGRLVGVLGGRHVSVRY